MTVEKRKIHNVSLKEKRTLESWMNSNKTRKRNWHLLNIFLRQQAPRNEREVVHETPLTTDVVKTKKKEQENIFVKVL